MKLCLGIESTAHTFGVGIVDENLRILSNEKESFRGKGIKPQEAADFHINNAEKVLKRALEKANVNINDIDVFSFSQGPGLGPCLKVGATIARTLAILFNKPLIPVNHCIAHIEIGKTLTKAKDPVVLYVSGGNTQIISLHRGRYRIFGETLDIGLGNLLDSFGRSLGIDFPAGPKLDEIYFKGKKYYKLPYTVKGMDLSFSGLQTAAEKLIGKVKKEDLVYSLMHTAFAMTAEVCERAMAYANKKELLLVGGVGASKALRKMLGKMCNQRGAKLLVTPKEYCTDNGAMIALLGMKIFKSGVIPKETKTIQKLRIDETEVTWN